MEYLRNTYAKIYLNNIRNNVEKIRKKYNDYKYYFGIVKADAYGHGAVEVVEQLINGGCNYLAVALLEEALEIRNKYNSIPILCLGVVAKEDFKVAYDNNITITVNSLEKGLEVVESGLKLRVHIKINSGMNRLGIKDKKEFLEVFDLLKKNNIEIEGIYSHLMDVNDEIVTQKQIDKYKDMVVGIKKEEIPIFHIEASEGIIRNLKLDFVNGCRLGIMIYGFTSDKTLNLQKTFSLVSKIVQINRLNKGERLGYNGIYQAQEDNELIGVVAIGYADGVIRKNTGREVYIKNKKYKIVGNICMDMLFVKIDEDVEVGDEVVILKDVQDIEIVASYLETIPYEVLCSVSKRVPRVYVK